MVSRGYSWSLVVTRGHSKVFETIALSTKIVGAGDGDRTRMASLEGWAMPMFVACESTGQRYFLTSLLSTNLILGKLRA